ncbi:hypothetical protein N9K47_00090 [bacterium]|nr:hypothetical protein [bacterium]
MYTQQTGRRGRRRCMIFAQMAGLLAMLALLLGAFSAVRGRMRKP